MLHDVENRVAISSLVLVRVTDDTQLSVSFIYCVHIAKFIIYYVYFMKLHVHKNIAILNMGYDVVLHDKNTKTYNW